ncbi:MAG TPA: Hpt domain-containing protein [Acidobacteriota bacterium]|nr:Hpt domain-containing protein [Acidobacteriota bacterium]
MERTPIDVADALARMGDDRDFLKELLDIYMEDLSIRVAGLRGAVAGGDFKAVEQLGHAIKGSSANLSLPLLRDRAAAIELAGKNGEAAKVLASLDGLEKEFQRLRDHLRENPL